MNSQSLIICDEELILLPEKAVWWPSRKVLLVADVHLGKVNHFRKAGVPVPQGAAGKNWETLVELVMRFKPERFICIGDLFHSAYNYDWDSVKTFTSHFKVLSVELVTGNHDVLSDYRYHQSAVTLHREWCLLKPFMLIHIPPKEPIANQYVLSGHIHPGVRLVGKGRQALTLPCFYFSEQMGLLPAFGAFTGLSRLAPRANDRIFAIAENRVLPVN